MKETVVLVDASCGGSQLVTTDENFFLKRIALVAQGIVDTALGVPFHIKVAG